MTTLLACVTLMKFCVSKWNSPEKCRVMRIPVRDKVGFMEEVAFELSL